MKSLRDANIGRMARGVFDVLIVGGGINGAVSAAALANRGCRVALIDRADFASGTSQESSNLVWGGIKYLENYELGLVRDLCLSRNRLLSAYPSTVREVRFFTAVEREFRYHPAFMWLGTWAYWFFGDGFTQRPRYLTRKRIAAEEPAIRAERFVGGVEYSDAYLSDNDARFVFGFVRSALNVGAVVANYVELTKSRRRSDGLWVSTARDLHRGGECEIVSKVIVNAAGPWADGLNAEAGVSTRHRHVFSKGIHLVVPRITEVERVLTFFDDGGRMFFVIPMGPRSVIGTTDTRVESPEAVVSDEDRDFVLAQVNERLQLPRPLSRADVIAERCGVRPLVVEGGAVDDDVEWIALSRKHAIDVDSAQSHVSLYGGKLTDCLNMGEEVVEIVESLGVPMAEAPGRWFGEPSAATREEFFRQARLMRIDELRESATYEKLSTRLWRRYGLRAFSMLETIRREPGMEQVLIEGSQYLRCELYHAATTEMVTKLEDFLRRRSKIALVIRHEEIAAAEGIREACRLLFGKEAARRYDEYFDEGRPPTG